MSYVFLMFGDFYVSTVLILALGELIASAVFGEVYEFGVSLRVVSPSYYVAAIVLVLCYNIMSAVLFVLGEFGLSAVYSELYEPSLFLVFSEL